MPHEALRTTEWNQRLIIDAKTPDEIVAQINKAVVDVLKTDEVRKRFLTRRAEAIGTTPQETAAFLERERALWGGVVDEAKLKAE
jgi:tripartite-type tricarboxylate transporter receptor subunit TctC